MQSSFGKALSRPGGLIDQLLQRLNSKWFVWLLIGFGAALRLREYSLNNALYEDEAALALNVINKSATELFGPLESNQIAPPGFLLLEKLAVSVFGTNEYSLRLFPLLLSLLSLILFYELARRYVSGAALLFALGLFTASPYLIHYSAQVKQYSGDVAIAIGITLAGVAVAGSSLSIRTLVLFGALGAGVVWFSHPSVFVLAGVGSTLCLVAMWRRDRRRLGRLTAACGIWALSFLAFFLVSVRAASDNAALEQSWQSKGTFMPAPPHSFSELLWFPETLVRFFTNPFTTPIPAIAIIALIVGVFAAYRTSRQRLLLVILPVVFTVVASGLHKYPFGRRLVLFLVPGAILLIAAGVQLLLTGRAILQPIGVLLALLLIGKPLAGAASHARWGPQPHDIRSVMSYVMEHRQPGDLTYFYRGQRDAFRYYAPKLGFKEGEYVLGTDPPGRAKGPVILEAGRADADQLRGRGRVWLVFSNARTYEGVSEEEFMCGSLDGFGRRLDSDKHASVAAYLYDTSGG